jgi:SulP family sulfate permease
VERAQLHVDTVVIRLARVPFMDATGMHTLTEIIERFQRRRIRVLLVEVPERLGRSLERSGVIELAGAENVHADLASALRAIGGTAGASSR